MSIARFPFLAFSLALLAVASGPSGARGGEPRPEAEPVAEAAPPPAGDDGATAAEPVPAVPVSPPLMPATVVTPSGVQGESTAAPKPPPAAGAAGGGKPGAAAAAKTPTSAATPSAAAAALGREQPRAVSLGRYGAIELGRPPQAASRWRGFPISLSLRDAPLPEVLRSFARIAGVNLVLQPGVTGTVTVELHDVPWDQALYVILKTHGLAAEIDGRVWLVEPM
jgi:hypothetical protein